MPRRPDPETGLMPSEVVAQLDYPAYDLSRIGSAASPGDMGMLSYAPPPRRTRQAETTAPIHAPDTTRISAQRNYTRNGVDLHVRNYPRNAFGVTNVIDHIVWRSVPDGDVAEAPPLFIDEPGARDLAEMLGEFHPEMRRLQRTREQLDSSQNEVRSLMNQLEEVRSHNNTLVRVNEEQQRQIRWLERELRDSNQERRAAE